MKWFLFTISIFLLFACKKDRTFEHGPVDCSHADAFTGEYSGTHYYYVIFPNQDTTHIDTCLVSNISDSYTCKLSFSILNNICIIHEDNSIESTGNEIQSIEFSGDSLFVEKYFQMWTGGSILTQRFRGKKI